MYCESRLAVVALALVSMSGDSALTVTDSETPASFNVRSMESCLPSATTASATFAATKP